MKKLRVVVLTQEYMVPPENAERMSDQDFEQVKADYDVIHALEALGHETTTLGLSDELAPLRVLIEEWKPHIVFNLVEEFQGRSVYDQNVVSYLELMRVPYTGNNPRGMVIARDKPLTKKILHYHRIPTPGFVSFPLGRKARRPKALNYPLMVKPQAEESSMGISQDSVVSSDEKLEERVRFIHESIGSAAMAEEYIEGREIYMGVIGNRRIKIMPPWELQFADMPTSAYHIATRKVKFEIKYQEKYGIKIGPAKGLSAEVKSTLERLTRRIYRVLGLTGYARLDFRLDENDKPYLLEANPNPDISSDEELASAAKAAGIKYPELIQKILSFGMRRDR